MTIKIDTFGNVECLECDLCSVTYIRMGGSFLNTLEPELCAMFM